MAYKSKVYLENPNIGLCELNEIKCCLDDNPSTAGKATPNLERQFSEYFGKQVVAVNSGTSALHLALMVLGIGQDDEVVLPVTTFVATANAIRYVGAKPVFVDIKRDTWCLDWESIQLISYSRAKVFIPVHLYGNVCEVHPDCLVIEDAAESLGALYNGTRAGAIGEIGCLSFNGNKTITGGCGGLVVCSSNKQATMVRNLCSPQLAAETGHIGYNYRMPSINAALVSGQWSRFDDLLAKKKRFRQIYENELGDYVKFQQATLGATPSWWYTAGTFDRPVDDVISRMHGIPFRRVFKPVTAFEAYRDGNHYPNAEHIYKHGICLPSSTRNTDKDIQFVCRAIRKVL